MALKTSPMFTNPFWQESFPDPFVLKVRGRYYAYATENERSPGSDAWVFPILTSDDFVHWRFLGKALRSFGAPFHSYWAPEVTEHNGRFYLYYAVHAAEEFLGAIRVAVADRPEGPFVDSGRDLTSELVPWAIDPHVFRDQDGQWYLFMTIEYLDDPSGFVGSGNAVVRLLDPLTVAGPLTRVTSPAHAWQLFEAKRPEKNGIDWYTVEGPAVMRHRNRYYEMYSGGCYLRENYAVSYATSVTPLGPDGMQDSSWQDWPGNQQQEVLLSVRKDHVLGPGHNSLVLGPNNADLYMAYHAWPPEMTARRPFLDRLFWHGDELWTPGPTYLPQLVPAQPALRELFHGPVIDSSWQQISGDWYLAPGEVIQNDPSSALSLLHQRIPLEENWLLEIHMRLLEGDGFYGILLRGESDMTIALASTVNHRLVIWASTSQEEPLHVLPLKPDFDLQAWHRLLLSRSGALLCVHLDSLLLLELPISQAASSFALCTESCSVAFTGITLTHHFRDEILEFSLYSGLSWLVSARCSGWRSCRLAHSGWCAHSIFSRSWEAYAAQGGCSKLL